MKERAVMNVLERYHKPAILIAMLLAGIELARDVIHITGGLALVR
jgi:hypothetical protein